jgi:hypothetical protein
MQNDKMEKKQYKNIEEKKRVHSGNSTNPTLATWEHDKKKKTFKRRTYKKRLKLNKKMSMKMQANSG